jgi:hypothetical protein
MIGSLPDDAAGAGPLAVLSRFRRDFRTCLTARGDEIFELTNAVLCAGGPVRSVAAARRGDQPRPAGSATRTGAGRARRG